MKRKISLSEYQAKRKRMESKSDKDSTQSVVNKIGDWSGMTNQSNAIATLGNQRRNNSQGEPKFVLMLATLDIRIENKSENLINCRALADTGASVNCISEQFVEENHLKTIKCQKPILGVSGPEILKKKLKVNICPWFTDKNKVEVEFFVINQLSGMYPNEKIDASKDQIKHLVLADNAFDIPAPIDALLGVGIYADILRIDLYKHKHGAVMQSTSFGHIVLGKFMHTEQVFDGLPIFNVIQKDKTNDDIAEALNKFWQCEEVNTNENKMCKNKEQLDVLNFFKKTYYREENGRYQYHCHLNQNTS